ncbi:hypothetical protein NPIL_49791, partial [Nephila pilipes]
LGSLGVNADVGGKTGQGANADLGTDARIGRKADLAVNANLDGKAGSYGFRSSRILKNGSLSENAMGHEETIDDPEDLFSSKNESRQRFDLVVKRRSNKESFEYGHKTEFGNKHGSHLIFDGKHATRDANLKFENRRQGSDRFNIILSKITHFLHPKSDSLYTIDDNADDNSDIGHKNAFSEMFYHQRRVINGGDDEFTVTGAKDKENFGRHLAINSKTGIDDNHDFTLNVNIKRKSKLNKNSSLSNEDGVGGIADREIAPNVKSGGSEVLNHTELNGKNGYRSFGVRIKSGLEDSDRLRDNADTEADINRDASFRHRNRIEGKAGLKITSDLDNIVRLEKDGVQRDSVLSTIFGLGKSVKFGGDDKERYATYVNGKDGIRSVSLSGKAGLRDIDSLTFKANIDSKAGLVDGAAFKHAYGFGGKAGLKIISDFGDSTRIERKTVQGNSAAFGLGKSVEFVGDDELDVTGVKTKASLGILGKNGLAFKDALGGSVNIETDTGMLDSARFGVSESLSIKKNVGINSKYGDVAEHDIIPGVGKKAAPQFRTGSALRNGFGDNFRSSSKRQR